MYVLVLELLQEPPDLQQSRFPRIQLRSEADLSTLKDVKDDDRHEVGRGQGDTDQSSRRAAYSISYT